MAGYQLLSVILDHRAIVVCTSFSESAHACCECEFESCAQCGMCCIDIWYIVMHSEHAWLLHHDVKHVNIRPC